MKKLIVESTQDEKEHNEQKDSNHSMLTISKLTFINVSAVGGFADPIVAASTGTTEAAHCIHTDLICTTAIKAIGSTFVCVVARCTVTDKAAIAGTDKGAVGIST